MRWRLSKGNKNFRDFELTRHQANPLTFGLGVRHKILSKPAHFPNLAATSPGFTITAALVVPSHQNPPPFTIVVKTCLSDPPYQPTGFLVNPNGDALSKDGFQFYVPATERYVNVE